MIITIENFGAIKYFQFDTEKDLYLIFGKNSVGKSYAISLVYLILKNISNHEITYSIYDSFKKSINTDINIVLQEIDKNNIKDFDYSQYVNKHIALYFDAVLAKAINASLQNTFGKIADVQNKFSNENLKITIKQYTEFDLNLSIVFGITQDSNQSMQLKCVDCYCDRKFILRNMPFDDYLKSLNSSNDLVSHFFSKQDDKEEFIKFYESKINLLVNYFLDEFRLSKNRKVYYFPASRSGLYQTLSAFGQIIAELVKNRHLISKPIVLPAISEPVADYFLYLSEINTSNQLDTGFSNYVNEIEKEILKGVVDFDDESKKIVFMPNETALKLDLSSTSSMVSEISPIVSYLKYILDSTELKPIIFIEELEAHLHPEAQVKLMEIFAKMVKDNKIKLVMTSHSNYIFNKASNLVIDNKIDKEKFAAVLFDPTPEGSIARDLETDEYGIEDENFIDTAESLYEEKMQLFNKLNA